MIFNVIKANTQINELTTKLGESVKLNEQLNTLVEDYKQKEAAFSLGAQDWAAEKETLLKGHEEAIKTLEDKYKAEIEALKASKTEAKESAGKQAADIVASLGIEPDTIKVSKTEPTDTEIVKKFESLTGPEKNAYYQANREKILKVFGYIK